MRQEIVLYCHLGIRLVIRSFIQSNVINWVVVLRFSMIKSCFQFRKKILHRTKLRKNHLWINRVFKNKTSNRYNWFNETNLDLSTSYNKFNIVLISDNLKSFLNVKKFEYHFSIVNIAHRWVWLLCNFLHGNSLLNLIKVIIDLLYFSRNLLFYIFWNTSLILVCFLSLNNFFFF